MQNNWLTLMLLDNVGRVSYVTIVVRVRWIFNMLSGTYNAH